MKGMLAAVLALSLIVVETPVKAEGATTSATKTAKTDATTAKKTVSKKKTAKAKAKKVTLTCAQKASFSSKKQGSKNANAKKIYSILSAAGIPKINIAGVLGNWDVESELDPTCVEGIYTEDYKIGSRKSRALRNPSSQAYRCFSMYAASGLSINRSAYRRANGTVWPGIGIGGYTGRSIDPLMRFAKRNHISWWSLECQVAYAVNSFSRAKWLANWKKPAANTYDAASKFLRNWEGCYIASSKRAAKASKWLSKIRRWKPDLEYGRAVLSMR